MKNAGNRLMENIKIDLNLTPSNSSMKGYRWVKDTIFTPFAPTLFEETKNLVKKGYCLGQPSKPNASKICVGLYGPKG